MDGQAFTVFSEKFLGPQLWAGAVVVMDNLPAHKLYHFSKFMQSVAIADRI
jgi:putative transposase